MIARVREGRMGRLPRSQRWWALVGMACLVAALAACAAQPSTATTQTPKPTRTVLVPTATPAGPTATPAPTPVQIADLGAFRQAFASAFGSNQWAKVQVMLSPEFSFQNGAPGTAAGSHALMPDSANYLQSLFQKGGGWSQGSTGELSAHFCYAGNTPVAQQIGFNGNNGHFVMFGLNKWQGYWVASWAFDDPQGGYNGCITGE